MLAIRRRLGARRWPRCGPARYSIYLLYWYKSTTLTQKALLADNGPQLGKLSDGGPQLGKLPVGGLSSRSEAAAPPLGDKALQEMLRNQLEAQAKGREAKAHSGSAGSKTKKGSDSIKALLRRF